MSSDSLRRAYWECLRVAVSRRRFSASDANFALVTLKRRTDKDDSDAAAFEGAVARIVFEECAGEIAAAAADAAGGFAAVRPGKRRPSADTTM